MFLDSNQEDIKTGTFVYDTKYGGVGFINRFTKKMVEIIKYYPASKRISTYLIYSKHLINVNEDELKKRGERIKNQYDNLQKYIQKNPS